MKPLHKGLHILANSFSNLVKVYKNGNENIGKIRIRVRKLLAGKMITSILELTAHNSAYIGIIFI